MKRGPRFIYGVVAIVFLLIVGILLMSSGGGGGDEKTPKSDENVPKPLKDYANTSAKVSLTIKGTIVSREEHREIRITIGRNLRQLDVIKGYQNQVIKDKSYTNDRNAYSEFLQAISSSNFTRERSNDLKTEAGVCPLGNRYVFTLSQNGEAISRLWTSTCSGVGRGTFGGETNQLLSLFQRQIPAYDELTQRVRLN